MGDIGLDDTERRTVARRPGGWSSPPDQVARLSALYDVSRKFASAGSDVHALLSVIARQGAELLGEMCLVTLLSDDGRRLQVEAVEHPDDAAAAERTRRLFLQRPYDSARGPAGEAIRSGRPVRMIADGPGATPLSPEDRAYVERFGIRSWLIVPLMARGRVLGTLGLWRTSARSPFAEADEHFVQQLADLAALALANARLLEDANRRAGLLRSLYLSETAAAAGRDPRQSLAAIADQLLRHPGIDAVVVAEARDAQESSLRVLASDGAVSPGADLPLSRPYAQVLASRRAACVKGEGALGLRPRGADPASAWILPIPAHDTPPAVLVVASASDLSEDPELLSFLETVAARIATVLDIAHLEAAVRRLGASVGAVTGASAVPGLTASEQRILPLLVAGRTNDEIARAVHLSPNTVKFHVSHILRKLDAVNRVEAARAAMRLGLLETS